MSDNDAIEDYSAADIASCSAKGMLPTNVWPVGNTIREVVALQLPSDLPAGTYNLYIGMYNSDTQTRLPVQIETGESNELVVSKFEVTETH